MSDILWILLFVVALPLGVFLIERHRRILTERAWARAFQDDDMLEQVLREDVDHDS